MSRLCPFTRWPGASLLVVFLVVFFGLGTQGSAASAPKGEKAAPEFPDESARLALFRSLVGDLRALHVFSEGAQANFGRTWDEELPALEEAFRKAVTEDELALALHEPLVGEPTRAGFTAFRARRVVRLPSGRRFGLLHIALSYEESSHSGARVEGVPLHIDRPLYRTWANRAGYDVALVREAIDALTPPTR